MLIRLQKYLADSGAASRRAAERLITEGRVKVNGAAVTELGTKVEAGRDRVALNGREISPKAKPVYFMLHKPEEYVTTVKDQFGRKTVLDLMPETGFRLFPVGRLDYDSSGLLLLTNDGELTHKLTHPSHDIEKIYIARLKGVPDAAGLNRFRAGLVIDGYKTSPARIELIKTEADSCSAKITIKEGRNRQVRKMCEEIGHRVMSLKRVATGRLFLGDLPKGKWRRLTAEEIAYLKSL